MRSDKVTTRQRVEAVLDLKCRGALFHQIRQFASEQEPPWNVSDRQLRRYSRAADKLLARILDRDTQRRLRLHIARRETLYALALSVSDYATARLVLADQAELERLYPPKRVEASGPNGGPIPTANVELTDDERTTAIKALMGRVPGLGAADTRPHPDESGDAPGCAVGASRKGDDGRGDDAGPLAGEVAPLNL